MFWFSVSSLSLLPIRPLPPQTPSSLSVSRSHAWHVRGWAACRRAQGSAEWSPVLHPGQRAHGGGAAHGVGLCPCPWLPLWTSLSCLGPGDHGTRSLPGLLWHFRVVTLPASGRGSQSMPCPFPWQPGSARATASSGDCPGRSAAWKWPLALYWRLPKGVSGGRRTWAGPELGLPLLSVTLLRGQPGHLEFGFRDHRSGVTGVLWPRLRWFVVGRDRGLGVTRLQTAALAGRFPAPWSVSGTPVPLAQWSSHCGSGEAAHRGWRPWGQGAHTACLLKPPCSYHCEDFTPGFLVEPARSVPTAQ